MMRSLAITLLLLSATFPATQTTPNAVTVSGRTEKLPDGAIALIGSGSSVSFFFKGKACSLNLQSAEPHHNYVSIELDGHYIGRYRIEPGEARWYKVRSDIKQGRHKLRVFKATEAANGNVVFNDVKAEGVIALRAQAKKKIEFIGNSITCGMGNDAIQIPCGSGEWYDQHNAYWAYGPVVSRQIGADFVLSSVSGIGMYRNWNDEHDKEPVMPEVYENLYLDRNSAKKYDFAFQPDLVSICLGTNDFSDGDGKKPRLPFDEKKYVANYVGFIRTVYKHAPKARIVLLNSPMISGEKNAVFVKCLKEVIAAFANDKAHKPIALFEFKPMVPKGCGYHPDIDDHLLMAQQLEPVLKKMLDEE